MTDPEESFSEEEEFAEFEADLAGNPDPVIPLEAEPADAVEQQLEVPEDDEDGYR